MKDDFEESLINLDERANTWTYNVYKVEENGPFFPVTEDEAIGVEHLLEEPMCDEELIDDILGIDRFNFNIKEFMCEVEHDEMQTSCGASDSELIHDLDEAKLEFVDDLLQGPEERVLDEKGIPVSCEDYLLKPNFLSGFNSDYSSSKVSCLTKPDSESYTLSINRRESTLDISKFLPNFYNTDPGMSITEYGVGSFEDESKMIFSSKNELSRRETYCFISIFDNTTIQDQHLDDKWPSDCQLMETSPFEVCKAEHGPEDPEVKEGVILTGKRLHKPSQRYMNESADQQANHHSKKSGISYKTSRDKFLQKRSSKQHCLKGTRGTPLIQRDIFLEGACARVPLGVPIEEDYLGENKILESEDFKQSESSPLYGNSHVGPFLAFSQDEISEDDWPRKRGKSQRKHHTVWTLSEVLKLIEGVSQCGVGRWSEIKRMHFSSSKHRTPVDLKDKWRNLLKACCRQTKCKREAWEEQRHASNHTTESILRRVRELTVLCPCPKERKFRGSLPVPAGTDSK